jgi:hypothetical protein
VTDEQGDKYRGQVPIVPKSKKVTLTEGKRPILAKATDKGSGSGSKSDDQQKD